MLRARADTVISLAHRDTGMSHSSTMAPWDLWRRL